MILFGSRAPLLKSAQSRTAACPHCGNHGTLVYSIYSKHAHIFWIPLFPMGRIGVAECRHCKYAMSPGEMPVQVKEEYTEIKKDKDIRIPIWQYTGLGIIGLIIGFAIVMNTIEKRTELE